LSQTFAELGVPAELVERLARRDITIPTPIQQATLTAGLAGRDVCGRAPTGSGKTLAFGIPMVATVGRARPRRPKALVLVPTRELAAQVRHELEMLAGSKHPKVAAFYGGVGFGGQMAALRGGTDIAVACPGRLADLVNRKEAFLDDVELVVVDEADRMADMGFLPQVRVLLDQVRPERQTSLFSATLDGAVGALIKRYQVNPVQFEINTTPDEPTSDHLFWRADRSERVDLTVKLVNANWPAIVFCRTKHGTDRLTGQLQRAGVAVAALHGGRSQGQRERALASFVDGRVQALVATDIAARGIHVDDVACVVHFDPPEDEKAYLHRSGRTGRAGASGMVVSLIGDDQAGDTRKLQAKLSLPKGVSRPDVGMLHSTAAERPKPRPAPSSALDGDGKGGPRPGRPRQGGAQRGGPASSPRRDHQPRPVGSTSARRRAVASGRRGDSSRRRAG
jgi:superfamily II DNA/RNA helicase